MAEVTAQKHLKNSKKMMKPTLRNFSPPRDIEDYSAGENITIIVFNDNLEANCLKLVG